MSDALCLGKSRSDSNEDSCKGCLDMAISLVISVSSTPSRSQPCYSTSRQTVSERDDFIITVGMCEESGEESNLLKHISKRDPPSSPPSSPPNPCKWVLSSGLGPCIQSRALGVLDTGPSLQELMELLDPRLCVSLAYSSDITLRTLPSLSTPSSSRQFIVLFAMVQQTVDCM